MQTNWTRIAFTSLRKKTKTVLRFKSSARHDTEQKKNVEKMKKEKEEIKQKAKTKRAWNKSTTNIKTIKQVSVKRTIVFCFGVFFCVRERSLKKLIRFLHRIYISCALSLALRSGLDLEFCCLKWLYQCKLLCAFAA